MLGILYILKAVHMKFHPKYFNYEMCEYTVIRSKSNKESFLRKNVCQTCANIICTVMVE